MNQNYAYFMQANLSEYLDEWVAIVDQKVVSHGKDVKHVFAQAKEVHPGKNPLLAKVPGSATLILGLY